MAGVWTKRLCASFFVQTTIQSLYMHRILVAGGVTMKKNDQRDIMSIVRCIYEI